jgi:hypothetical protein
MLAVVTAGQEREAGQVTARQPVHGQFDAVVVPAACGS